MTVSVGVGCLAAEAAADDAAGGPPRGALDRVDELLYVAKRTGRNAVAFRDPAGQVRLAGAASGRRGVDAVARAVCEAPRTGRVGH